MRIFRYITVGSSFSYFVARYLYCLYYLYNSFMSVKNLKPISYSFYLHTINAINIPCNENTNYLYMYNPIVSLQ